MSRATSDRDQAMVETRSRQRWALLPKEHGAYAELFFPLITALALGRLSMAQWFLAFAAVAAFLAHESVLVILGNRGTRARSRLTGQAKWASTILLAIACTTAALGLWQAPVAMLGAVSIPLFSTALLIPLILSHREKTLAGELLVALIFSTALIPVARAGDVAMNDAAVASAIWFVIFALQTLSVRAVKAQIKTDAGTHSLVPVLVILSLAVVVAALLVRTQGLSIIPIAAIFPAALAGLACVWLHVHPRHLRTLGWVLVACDVIALALLTAGSG